VAFAVAHGSGSRGGWSAIGCYCRGSAPTAWSAAGRGTMSKRHCSNSFFFFIIIIIIIFLFVGTQKWVTTLTVTNMQIIITKIGCRIGQSSKIKCDVLICADVREPSRSRNILNSKMSRGLLSAATKLEIMESYVPKTGAQLAAYMLLSRPLPSPRIASGLLLVVWSPICSSAPILGSGTVAVGMLITSRVTPVAAEVRVVMRHSMVCRKLWCWQQRWLLRQRRRRQQRGSGNHGMERVLVQKFMGKKVVVKINIE